MTQTTVAFRQEDREERVFRAWIALINQRIDEYRSRNDSHSIDDRDTARLRGRIAELKDLLALVAPPPQQASASPEQADAWGREADD